MKTVNQHFQREARFLARHVPAHKEARKPPKQRYPLLHGALPKRKSPFRPLKPACTPH